MRSFCCLDASHTVPDADEEGNIDLGPLRGGIANVSAKLGAAAEREWTLPFVRPPLPTILHVAAGTEQEVR